MSQVTQELKDKIKGALLPLVINEPVSAIPSTSAQTMRGVAWWICQHRTDVWGQIKQITGSDHGDVDCRRVAVVASVLDESFFMQRQGDLYVLQRSSTSMTVVARLAEELALAAA